MNNELLKALFPNLTKSEANRMANFIVDDLCTNGAEDTARYVSSLESAIALYRFAGNSKKRQVCEIVLAKYKS
jgi:hypothetical protein